MLKIKFAQPPISSPANPPSTTANPTSSTAASQQTGQSAPVKPRRGRPPSKVREQLLNDEIGSYPIEEHLILRFPKNDPVGIRFREVVRKRKEFPPDFEIVWKGTIIGGDSSYHWWRWEEGRNDLRRRNIQRKTHGFALHY